MVLDGEGVILRQDGVADFDRPHSRRQDVEVQLLGFDLLELDGTLRMIPSGMGVMVSTHTPWMAMECALVFVMWTVMMVGIG